MGAEYRVVHYKKVIQKKLASLLKNQRREPMWLKCGFYIM